ncbi:MAG: hypothetical protein GTO55_04500 [Armatimonadetes bacterium]|nr:hypothetical protein [Armatimonadota bacterium]NIM23527.1 hypothetical protein [Armatimonadota bacterium]NIM67393.1 hypothetical protein [Armatimonadota bacterium]NIM75894.1 hypothetical protein [Armatimonadota bacterium]NIN05579.1 hypothetical protein [Armatimonadota bacterium]
MNLSRLRPRTQLLLAIFVPLFCIGLGLLLVLPTVTHLRKVGRDIEQTQKNIYKKKELIAQAEEMAGGRSLALAVALPDEQEPIIFLRQLAELTEASNVTIAAIQSTSPPPLPRSTSTATTSRRGGPTSAPADSTSVGLKGERPVVPPATVQELTDQVTVEGTFNEILDLIVRLEGFDRILSVSQCRITIGGALKYPRLQAIFTLSRFIARPQPTPSATQPEAGH